MNIKKKNGYCEVNCQYNLVFDDGQHAEYIIDRLFDRRTSIWWKEFLNGIISSFSNIGHEFDYIGEMNINTIVDNRDRTYDFYIKHNMHAVEWAIKIRLIKNK